MPRASPKRPGRVSKQALVRRPSTGLKALDGTACSVPMGRFMAPLRKAMSVAVRPPTAKTRRKEQPCLSRAVSIQMDCRRSAWRNDSRSCWPIRLASNLSLTSASTAAAESSSRTAAARSIRGAAPPRAACAVNNAAYHAARLSFIYSISPSSNRVRTGACLRRDSSALPCPLLLSQPAAWCLDPPCCSVSYNTHQHVTGHKLNEYDAPRT